MRSSRIIIFVLVVCKSFALIKSQGLLKDFSRNNDAVSSAMSAYQPSTVIQPFVQGFVVIPTSNGLTPALTQPVLISASAQQATQPKLVGPLFIPQSAETSPPTVQPSLIPQTRPQAAVPPALRPSVQKTVLVQSEASRPSVIVPSINSQENSSDDSDMEVSSSLEKSDVRSKVSKTASIKSKEGSKEKIKKKPWRIQAGGGNIGFVKAKD